MLPKDAHLPVTPKGNVKRKEVGSILEKEINILCRGLEGWDEEMAKDKISDKIVSDLSGAPPVDVKASASFYKLGTDSLQALSPRTSLSKCIGAVS